MMIETIHLAHMPSELALYATVFRNVQNTQFLREQLLAGNSDFEYAFIDASMVVTRKHVLAAAFRAMNDYIHDRLKSRNIHSEIVFALSPNNNIGEAFRRFGIGETTKDLLVLKVATSKDITANAVQEHLIEQVKGEQIALDDSQIRQLSDISRIRKIYKLSSIPNAGKQTTVDPIELETQIIGLMALRGAA